MSLLGIKESNEFLLFRCKALILELLAAVCLVELGHDVVLAAFNNFRIVKKMFNSIYQVYWGFFVHRNVKKNIVLKL